MKRIAQIVAVLCSLAVVLRLAQLLNAWLTANKWDTLKPGDWASWIQAVGSIAAIVYAVKIADRDRGAQRSEKEVFAVLQGQSIKHQLEDFTFMARHHGENLTADDVFGGPANELLDWFSRQPMWTVEEIALLAALPDGTAIDFAKGQAAIRAAIVEMNYARAPDMPWSDGESMVDARMRRAKNSVELYWKGLHLLESVKSRLPDTLPDLQSQR